VTDVVTEPELEVAFLLKTFALAHYRQSFDGVGS
jgi:hypothetical protein